MEHPECIDCGAFLQEYRRMGQEFLRCPWANESDWRLDTYHVVVRIYCNRPMGARRVVGGMTTISRD